jgi:hypothetical protein
LLDNATYADVFCERTVVDINGYGSITVPAGLSGNSYIVGLKFRNTLHVFSSNALQITGPSDSIDLTIPQNCCANTKVINGIAFACSGEVADASFGLGYYDGIIESTDFGFMENSVYTGDTGYVITDLTGDRIVDSLDYFIEQENVNFTMIDCHVSNCLPLVNGISVNRKTGFSIYPNPSYGVFKIDFKEYLSSARIKLISQLGDVCRNVFYENESEINLDCTNLSPGLYNLLIETGGKIYSGKIVIL